MGSGKFGLLCHTPNLPLPFKGGRLKFQGNQCKIVKRICMLKEVVYLLRLLVV